MFSTLSDEETQGNYFASIASFRRALMVLIVHRREIAASLKKEAIFKNGNWMMVIKIS